MPIYCHYFYYRLLLRCCNNVFIYFMLFIFLLFSFATNVSLSWLKISNSVPVYESVYNKYENFLFLFFLFCSRWHHSKLNLKLELRELFLFFFYLLQYEGFLIHFNLMTFASFNIHKTTFFYSLFLYPPI